MDVQTRLQVTEVHMIGADDAIIVLEPRGAVEGAHVPVDGTLTLHIQQAGVLDAFELGRIVDVVVSVK